MTRREHNEKDALRQLERYSQLLKAKEVELREVMQRASLTERSISFGQENSSQLNADKFINEMEKLNQVVLAKNKEIVELRSQQMQPGAAAASGELKTLRI
ncbi:unnamed protein product [Sphagnum jensenii]